MIQAYAKADVSGRVEELGSSVFLTDLTGWVQIDEGEGDRYAHAQGNYLEKPLMDADGTHNYILDGSTIREATAAEKEAEKASFPGPEPSREEQLEAQVAALQSQVDALLGVRASWTRSHGQSRFIRRCSFSLPLCRTNRRRRFRQCSRRGTRQAPTKQATGCGTRMFCINA